MLFPTLFVPLYSVIVFFTTTHGLPKCWKFSENGNELLLIENVADDIKMSKLLKPFFYSQVWQPGGSF